MSNFDKINNVLDTAVHSIDGVAKAQVKSFNGADIIAGPAGASDWVAGTNVQWVGYAPSDDVTSWTWYDRIDDGTPDAYDIAYGKDGSGNGIYVCTNDSSNKELSISSTDVMDGDPWTHKDIDSGANDQFVVCWSNDSTSSTSGVWICVGSQSTNESYYRSTDGGANWTEISLSGISGHTSTKITALAADGQGNWMMGQNDRIYYSDDDGASFSLVHTFTGESITRISGAVYTNNSWVVSYERSTDSNKTYFKSCAASDRTTWSAEAGGGSLQSYGSGNLGRTSIAADSSGRIAIVPHNRDDIGYADIDGTTISNFGVFGISSVTPSSEKARDVTTDGSTWLVVGQDGILLRSTDNAETWELVASDIYNSTVDVNCIAGNVYLPLT